jgi:tripartite-type tricarboxylate transporter receptor subunit TctC
MIAPIATPPAIIARLHDAIVEALRDPDVLRKLSSRGMILEGTRPDDFAAFIHSEIEKWSRVGEAAVIVKN